MFKGSVWCLVEEILMEMESLNCSVVNVSYCHPKGMLDRDQRTAKFTRKPTPEDTMCHNKHPRECSWSRAEEFHYGGGDLSHRTLPRSRVTNCFSRRTRHSYVYKSLQRLQRVLFVGVYLLCVANVPYSHTAPTTINMADRNEEPFWIKPCGSASTSEGMDSSDSSDHAMLPALNHTMTARASAYNDALGFKEEFAKATFSKSFDVLFDEYKQFSYDFLPSLKDIPKYLNETPSSETLKSLKRSEIIPHMYQQLQKIAVGLEQTIIDQKAHEGKFLQRFSNATDYLKIVLCELSNVIDEGRYVKKADINRDHMDSKYRNCNQTERDLRDLIIFVNYMNALEYLEAVLRRLIEDPEGTS